MRVNLFIPPSDPESNAACGPNADADADASRDFKAANCQLAKSILERPARDEAYGPVLELWEPRTNVESNARLLLTARDAHVSKVELPAVVYYLFVSSLNEKGHLLLDY
jgi:hypothetical protein